MLVTHTTNDLGGGGGGENLTIEEKTESERRAGKDWGLFSNLALAVLTDAPHIIAAESHVDDQRDDLERQTGDHDINPRLRQ